MTGKPAPAPHEVAGGLGARRRPGAVPLQGLLFGEAAMRWGRVHSKDFAGSPAGQVLGSVDRVRPAKDVVRTMVEQWIDTTEPQRPDGRRVTAGRAWPG